MSGTLYIVPTPIGNLGDMTLRAIEVLKKVDTILAEDTRTSSFLMKHFSIETPLRPYHMHNEHKVTEELVKDLVAGKEIAMISDAGTPGISDSGFLLVREAVAAGCAVSTLPGPVAFVPALINSGFPCNEFSFYGFLPQKKGRKTRIEKLAQEEKTFVLYESPFRLAKLLHELGETLGKSRRASVSREISKLYEETRRGTLDELAAHFNAHSAKGEITVVVQGQKAMMHEREA
jgi:16S rRNA (cytidine1402-2'-O)-methyltransferase